MKRSALRRLALSLDVRLDDEAIENIVNDPELRETISLFTYAEDLFDRLKGVASGPAVLALWRGFAWTKLGSPKKKFQLTADVILESASRLAEVLRKQVDGN